MLIADWQRVTHRLLNALDAELAGLGLSAAETNALACLAAEERPTARRLAEATGQRPSTLTGVLDRLERRKLIERRPNSADRRSTRIVLTDAGDDAAQRVAEAFDRVAARLPAGTAVALERLLGEVEASLAPGGVSGPPAD